jgi:RecB family exonuclease
VRVPDLHEFRRVLRALAGAASPDACAVLMPNHAAAQLLECGAGLSGLPFSDGPPSVTRDELFALLRHRLPAAPRLLTPFERDAMAQAAAAEAAAAVPDLSFRVRPGLVSEVLRFYDQLRRHGQTVRRFAELINDALAGGATIDRGTRRMLLLTDFLERTFAGYESRAAGSGALDEHLLRARLLTAPAGAPLRHLIVTVADWIADPDGLFVADYDLLARMPGLEQIDVICPEPTLRSGFHQRLHDWLPGIEEVSGTAVAGEGPRVRPTLVTPRATAPEQPWFVCRDREEELLGIARAYAAPARAHHLRLAVVYKRPLPYLYLAPATLAAAGVDVRTADALPLAAEPSAAAVDLVVSAAETSCSRDALVGLLRSVHFGFGDRVGSPEAIAAFDRRLSEVRYLGESERLEALANEWTDERSRPALGVAVEIAGQLTPWNQPAQASGAVRRLAAFLSTNYRPLAANDPLAARDRRARAAIHDVLEGLARAHEGHHDPLWSIADLSAAVRRWIEAHTFSHGERGGTVWLVDDQAARYGEFDALAIVGLVENEWPERPRRNIFYPPAVLKVLGWPSEKDRRASADARFLELLGSASRDVRLSTFTLEDEAIVMPATQLDEVVRAGLSSVSEVAPTVDLLLADEALTVDPPRLEQLDSRASEWAALRRERTPPDRPEFHGTAGPVRPRRKGWSVSALETYLDCPFKFFARYVLALAEEPEDEEVMDPRRQGQFMHAVFEVFFREWQTAGHGAITQHNLETARTLFAAIVDRELQRQQLSEAEAGLERTRLLGSPAAAGLGEAVFRMEAERPAGVVERLLEYPLAGELILDTPAGGRTVALAGKADRIDLLEDGTFRLVDYKLGWPPDRTRALQLPIYALFAAQSLRGYRGRTWELAEAAYLAFKGPRRVVPLFTSADQHAEVMNRAQQRLADTLDAIARGDFPPRPDDVYRCETCSFAAVCRKDYVAS